MIVKLFDKTEIVVSQKEADALTKAITRGVPMVTIKGMLVRTSAVAYIKPGGHTEADKIDIGKRIAPVDHRGEHSPAKEKLRKLLNR